MFLVRRAKIVIITCTLASLVVWGGYFEVQKITAEAQTVFVFGGPILDVEVCTCSGSFNVMISDFSKGVVPINYLYVPGISQLFAFFEIFRPGPMTLGTYVPGATCLIAHKFCTPATVPPIGTISLVGTSL